MTASLGGRRAPTRHLFLWLLAGAVCVLGAGTCAMRSLSETEAPEEPIALQPPPTSFPTVAALAAPDPPPPKPSGPPRFTETIEASAFLRGNLHTHSTRSDGDSAPADIYAYYRDHGYAFLVLTDHNTRTDPNDYRAEQRPGFVIVPGEEVTTVGAGKPVHVNALCSRRTIGGGTFATVREALGWAVARVKEQDAIALVNHPNFEWTLMNDDLPTARGAELLEIWSGHPYVNSEGDLLRPSHEAMWTKMLDAGERFAGVAVDDMHNLLATSKEPGARPLRGWVEVFGGQATEAAICDGLRQGKLYASSGPKLSRITVKDGVMAVTATALARVEFIGAEGAVLAVIDAPGGKEARYELRGGERYVRARITDKEGRRAWTQAYRAER